MESSGAGENRQRRLSILIPVYNEYAYVREAIRRVLAAPLPTGVERELVVVDDGSTDGTRDVLAELATEHPELQLILHEENQGKGAAIRTAIGAMSGDIAIFQDADLEYMPEEYGRVISPILEGYADVVYGSRFAVAQVRRVIFYHHMLGNMFLTHLSNLFTGLYLTDMETCYKAFRASILKSIPIRSPGFGLEPEITAKVAKRHCVVYEVPISYRGRSYDEGKKITWRDGFKALYVIIKYWVFDDCFDERYGHEVLQTMGEARHYARWIADLVRPSLGRHVLELGSGIGNMSRHLCGGRQFTVSDVDDTYLDLLHNQFDAREDVSVVKLDVSADEDFAALQGRGIDSVVAFNMLEHIEDDAAVLRRLHALLPVGGRVILQVPQYSGLFGRLDQDVGHHRRYDQLGLRALLAQNGFEIDLCRSVNWLGLPGWYLNSVLLGRRRLDRFQLKLFDMLVPLLRWTHWLPLPGLSLLAVARKR